MKDKQIEMLYEKAKQLANIKEISPHVTTGYCGCALLTDKGNVYTGISIDAHCGIGFCAEHSAISEMLKNGETRIIKIVAARKEKPCSPCGRCREFMRMINYDNLETEILVEPNKIIKLKDLLPYPFSAEL